MLEQGRGSVDGIPLVRMLGRGAVAGRGRDLYTYTVYIERSIKIDRVKFTQQVEAIMSDPRGWIRGGKVAFQRVPKWPSTQVVLATPDTVDKLCYPLQTEGKVSCRNGNKVVVNIDRWQRGVPHWPEAKTLMTYRQMLLQHEFGHRIGQNHRTCAKDGYLAPVMMQQTYGLQGCQANSWPLDYELP